MSARKLSSESTTALRKVLEDPCVDMDVVVGVLRSIGCTVAAAAVLGDEASGQVEVIHINALHTGGVVTLTREHEGRGSFGRWHGAWRSTPAIPAADDDVAAVFGADPCGDGLVLLVLITSVARPALPPAGEARTGSRALPVGVRRSGGPSTSGAVPLRRG